MRERPFFILTLYVGKTGGGETGWETGGDTGETPERHREGRQRLPEAGKRGREDPQRTLGNLAEDPGQRRTAGKYRRGPWTEENCRKVPQRALQDILEAHLEPT